MSNSILNRLERKLDRIAIEQLRAEVVRLDNELTETKKELVLAESERDGYAFDAENWRSVAMESDKKFGLTIEGNIVVLPESENAQFDC